MLSEADLIFVHAGRESRKLFGLQMYLEARAPRLLLSVGRYEIRRFARLPVPEPLDLLSIAAPIAPPLRHFFVSLSSKGVGVERVSIGRFGTMSEIRALREWLDRHTEIGRILIISNRAHRARVMWCCRKLLPDAVEVRFLPVPKQIVRSTIQGEPRKENGVMYFFTEAAKLLGYRLVLASRRLHPGRF